MNRNHTMRKYGFLIFLLYLLVGIASAQTNVDSLFQVARQLAFNKQYDQALQISEQILKQKPRYHEVRVFKARILAWTKQYDRSIKELKQVLRQQPGYTPAIDALIDVDFWSGRYQEALILCNLQLKRTPTDVRYLIRKARILFKMERYPESSRVVENILQIDPTNREARTLSKKLRELTRNTQLTIDYRRDTFKRPTGSYGPWELLYLEYSQRTPVGSVLLRGNLANRNFGSLNKSGFQIEMDAYPYLRKGTYFYLNAGYSEATVFPRYRIGGEIYQNLPNAFEFSVGIRYLDFTSTRITLYTGTLGKYIRNYWISIRPFISKKSSGYSRSAILLIRYYLSNVDNYLTFELSAGSSPVEIVSLQEFERLNTYRFVLELQKAINPYTFIRLRLGYQKEEYQVNKWGNIFITQFAFRLRL